MVHGIIHAWVRRATSVQHLGLRGEIKTCDSGNLDLTGRLSDLIRFFLAFTEVIWPDLNWPRTQVKEDQCTVQLQFRCLQHG